MISKKNIVYFIMGVSGVGKSTIAKKLSEKLKIPFFDGDDYHPEHNIKKMASVKPLNDDDRRLWLLQLNKLAVEQQVHNSCVIVCSALKERYRITLAKSIESTIRWIHLHGDFQLITDRLNKRKGHFMGAALLQTQYDTLEWPLNALDIDVKQSPESIVGQIIEDIAKCELGVFGLGVMGKGLARNIAGKGFRTALFNRHVPDKEEDIAKSFIDDYEVLSESKGFDKLSAFVKAMQRPRKIVLMVNAGKTVDQVIEDLLPHLDLGDIIIDGGNSNYNDTAKRQTFLQNKGIHFYGLGISGGEEGALNGPSLMPGGKKQLYIQLAPYFDAIAAKDVNNRPCSTYIGPEGSGHFVKMVHNGIEYAEMQLLAEVLTLFKAGSYSNDEIADQLQNWTNSAGSYLMDITIAILNYKEDKEWLLDKILDQAENKGTGNWATVAAAELGFPATMIGAALNARYVSALKQQRVQFNEQYAKEVRTLNIDPLTILKSYQFARLINHYQGFGLMATASSTYRWDLNLSEIARIWTNGCILKSDLMYELRNVLRHSESILSNADMAQKISEYALETATTLKTAIRTGLATPCLSESLQFFNGMTTGDSTASLIQAQRDFFGAHTYQRKNDPTPKYYHTNWNKKNG